MNAMVDIIVCSYNHESYISQCLEGILFQQTNFKIRVLIGDDCSTDNTRNIIASYKLKHSDIIFPFYRKRNIGAEGNSQLLFSETSAKYIAVCDGDDYWTDPLKLQKQVDFLEANPDFAFCYHHVKITQEDGFVNQKLEMKFNQPEVSTIENILKLNIWPHINSILFRRENMKKYPDWLKNCPSADWGIWILITGKKKIKYMPETMSVYRQHGGGFWSSNTKIQNAQRTLKSAKILKKHIVKGELRKHLYLPIHYSYIELISYYRKKNIVKFFYYSSLSKLLDYRNTFILKKEAVAGLNNKEIFRKIGSVVKRKLNLTNGN